LCAHSPCLDNISQASTSEGDIATDADRSKLELSCQDHPFVAVRQAKDSGAGRVDQHDLLAILMAGLRARLKAGGPKATNIFEFGTNPN
jgi:hypothetical protein